MDGIEIISKVDILVAANWVYPTFLIFVVLTFLCAVFSKMKETITRNIFTLIFAVGAMILLVYGPTKFTEPTGRYEYTAYIDKSVSMSEFFDKYDNIKFNGEVYKFEDKKIE